MEFKNRRLYRSRTDHKLAGVCGGLGEFFEIDSTLIRLAWVLVAAMTAVVPGVLAYLAAWLIVPEQPVHDYTVQPADNNGSTPAT